MPAISQPGGQHGRAGALCRPERVLLAAADLHPAPGGDPQCCAPLLPQPGVALGSCHRLCLLQVHIVSQE